MKNILKAILVFCFYKCVFQEPQDWGALTKWKFVMKPRLLNIYLALTILSPIIILIGGFIGLYQQFKRMSKTESWSSFEFKLEKNEKPSKFEAYKKF